MTLRTVAASRCFVNIWQRIPVLNHCHRIHVASTNLEAQIPAYEEKQNEPVSQKRARLLYQSRKRGMLENCLLLSTFASKHLKNFSENELKMYDRLINLPSNDWDIYYWATGVKDTPEEFNNKIMELLKEHVSNPDRETRFKEPALEPMS